MKNLKMRRINMPTMTVGELIEHLRRIDAPETPVALVWEGTVHPVTPEVFAIGEDDVQHVLFVDADT